MANKIKIATFSLYTFHVQADYEKTAQACLEFWKDRLDEVVCEQPDLIVLPECANRPSNRHGIWTNEQNIEYYRIIDERLLELAAGYAHKYSTNICVNQHRWIDDKRYNTSTFLNRDGSEAGIYKKNYLVVEEAQGGVAYSDQAELIKLDFGKVAVAICFDLNFEQLRKNYEQARPDLIVFSSMYHGGLLQQMWPYLCRCHFVASMGDNRIPAEIRNPFGQVLYTTTNYFGRVVGEVNLDCVMVHLDGNWDKLDPLRKAYGPEVKVHDPGLYGSVLISSNSESKTALDMTREFDIELLDQYMDRSIEHRRENI